MPRYVIERTFTYGVDLASARQLGLKTTGHAARGTIRRNAGDKKRSYARSEGDAQAPERATG